MNWHFLFHNLPWMDFHMIQTGHGRGSFPDIARLLRSLPWWRLRPAPERVQLNPPPAGPNGRAFCATSDDTWLIYLPGTALDGPTGARHVIIKGLTAQVQLQDQGWRASWFNPRTGQEQVAGGVELPGNLRWRSPNAPSEDDWVLLLRR